MTKLNSEEREAKFGKHLQPGDIKAGDLILFRHAHDTEGSKILVITEVTDDHFFPLKTKSAEGHTGIISYEEAFPLPVEEPVAEEVPVKDWKTAILWEPQKSLTLDDIVLDGAYFFHNSQVNDESDAVLDGKVCVVRRIYPDKPHYYHKVDVVFADEGTLNVHPHELTPFS